MRNFRMFREIFLLFIILCIAGCGENQSVENQSVSEEIIKEITTPSGDSNDCYTGGGICHGI